jgi:hypothetical protein
MRLSALNYGDTKVEGLGNFPERDKRMDMSALAELRADGDSVTDEPMNVRQIVLMGSATLLLSMAGCAAPDSADNVGSTSDDLRALLPEEVLGELHYGDTVSVDYTSTPRYRAYWFAGTKGDWLDVKVDSSTGGVDAFVVDDHYRSVRRGTRAVLPKTGKYYIAVREDALAPAKITIAFALTVVAPGEQPPSPDAD